MFVTEDMVLAMMAAYGRPRTATFEFPVDQTEYRRIVNSQKDGRNHDVTLYIRKGDKVVVIAKPFYPPGLYRAPSGGLHPGEDFRIGAAREAMEETGCEIEFEKFLLRTEVCFVCGDDRINWRSFVFKTGYAGGGFEFTDKREIKEVRLASLDEFSSFSKIMRASKIGGLHYRAALHDSVKNLL